MNSTFIIEFIQNFAAPMAIVFAYSWGVKIYNYLLNNTPKPKIQATSKYDKFMQYFMGFLVILYISTPLFLPLNFYKTINADVDGYSFQIRKRFNNHMEQNAVKYKKDPILKQRMITLCDLLVQDSKRDLYLKFGSQIESCEWCVDDSDFALYSIPFVVGSYFRFGIFFGIGSWNQRTNFRTFAAIFVAISICVEIGILWSEDILIILGREIQYDLLSVSRNYIFALWYSVLLIVGQGDINEKQIINNISRTSAMILQLNKTTFGIHAATPRDPHLKARYLLHQEKQEKYRKMFINDPETKVNLNLIRK
jgi:hypothetical protein